MAAALAAPMISLFMVAFHFWDYGNRIDLVDNS